ncbi:tetratricopeptide repeat protein [Opitutales bacterium]|nr:tetratricopeptide repeat protein [Opitutales bacterium]
MSISTKSSEAQEYFNQGLAWMHAFDHDEAIRSFARAAQLDPDCAMAWWAISLSEGPNYNAPVMDDERSEGAWGALQEAQARIGNASAKERALIEALSNRYANPWPEDRAHLEQAYADAMAEVWASYPNDSDIGALYAEAMMIQRPWKLYDIDRNSTGNTLEILEVLERVMKMDPGHPGVFHLYVHAVEPSNEPARALAAADHLRTMMPGAGHMLHMPSHIYVQTGYWDRSVVQNKKAVNQDDRYRELSPEQTIQNMYMVHNAHMLAFSAMMVGREAEAMKAARKMWAIIPPELLEGVAPFVDRWMSSVYEVQKRFGRWDDILAEPAPPSYMPLTTAQWRAHRAVASAAQKDFVGAEHEQAEFLKVKAAMPEDSPFGRDMAHKVLEVSEFFIAGEIALQKGNWEAASEWLEKAAAVEATLSYGEPPQYLQPSLHTLGAVYMKAGQFKKAESTYRKDLDKWKGNGWSLFGLSRALQAQGKTDEANKALADYSECWINADAPTTTSCECIQNI